MWGTVSSQRTITVDGTKFLVRGNYLKGQLEKHYQDFCQKFNSTMSFRTWLVQRGKVYFKVNSSRGPHTDLVDSDPLAKVNLSCISG